MRCFISLGLSKEASYQIRKIQAELENLKLFNGKFIDEENLHLTLKFLGEINEETLKKAKEALKQIKFNSFEAELGDLGVFSKDFVRIIWVEIKNAGKLQKEIDNNLSGIFTPEARFMSHITIARVKYTQDKNKLIESLKNMEYEKIKFNVNYFILMKSELKPTGPKYGEIEKYPLES
ncbi:MAG: RNA 2',3'-cyclic phosphodiesterase [Candidatus Nanoarchaeia archaeon]